MLRRILTVCGLLLAVLVAFDVAGVVACFVLDVAQPRYGSGLLLLAGWLVLGVFCGLFGFHFAAAAVADDAAVDRGGLVLATGVVFLLALGVGCGALLWGNDPIGDGFVPDSAVPTITFLGANVAGMALAWHVRDRPGGPAKA